MDKDFAALPHIRLIQEAFFNTFDSIIITEANLDPPGPRIVYINQRFTEMTGYSAEEVIGRTPRLLQGPRSDQAVIKYISRRLHAGQDFFGEIINYRKNGEPFYLQWRIVPVRSDNGQIINWVAVQHDISEFRLAELELARINRDLEQRVAARTQDIANVNQQLLEEIHNHKYTEARLRESERRFRLLVESVIDYAIFMLDTEGQITSWNAGAQRIKGYSAEEIIGQHFSIFYLPDDLECGLPEQALACARQEGRFENSRWRLRKNGERFWAHVVIDPIFDERGTLMGFAKITRDITEQRQAEEALNRTMEALMQSNASLEQFAYAASHDLKAPLRNIFSFMQLLEEECRGKHGEEVERYLHFIRDNADQMYNMIENVLEYSRVRADQSPQTNVDLNKILERVRRNLGQILRTSDALIEYHDLPTLRGYEPLLLQLFQNLLSNAIKFQPPGRRPRVQIQANQDDQGWRIIVSDNGIGIGLEHQEKIFNIFHRLQRHADYPGTGIGLAICKKAIERHHGTIEVVSTPGTGTDFIIYFPHSELREQL